MFHPIPGPRRTELTARRPAFRREVYGCQPRPKASRSSTEVRISWYKFVFLPSIFVGEPSPKKGERKARLGDLGMVKHLPEPVSLHRSMGCKLRRAIFCGPTFKFHSGVDVRQPPLMVPTPKVQIADGIRPLPVHGPRAVNPRNIQLGQKESVRATAELNPL